MNTIILLGGTQGVGKTTIAKKIAKHFGIPWISTDQIRSIMKATTDKEYSPDLFLNNVENDIPGLIIDEMKRAEAVWNGVLALIKNIHPWEHCVIEGTAILPHLVARDLSEQNNIYPLFLLQNDIEIITKIVEERSKLPWIKTKTKEEQEKKVELIVALNKKIKTEAEIYKYRTIDSDDCKDNFDDFIQTMTLS